MTIPTDLQGQALVNWLQDVMDRAQREMGRYVVCAFGVQEENPIVRASQRRMFYYNRRAYEQAKEALERTQCAAT